MRNYDYTNSWQSLLTPEIVAQLSAIHEFKGQQTLFIEAKSDVLTQLMEVAKIQSTEASNKIEGIYTSDDRLQKLVSNKTIPISRNEQEIAGYRDVLNTIHESYEFIPVRPSIILQLHRDLFKYSGMSIGGTYKTADNIITEEDAQGNKFVRFRPVPSWETAEAMEQLCAAFEEALSHAEIDPLLLIPMFILDFLCIHPFNDGNGRMSRLLTLLLLYRAGYIVGKYISIEKEIERSKDTYYDALQASSANWHDGTSDYGHFTRYLLGTILAAYREFSARVNTLVTSGLSKPDRIRKIIKDSVGKVTKAEIAVKCPDISNVTIQRALKELSNNGEILKIGGGRYTAYIWNRENEK